MLFKVIFLNLRSVRVLAKKVGNAYYEPTIVVHDDLYTFYKICDPVCKMGSYGLFNSMYLTSFNLTCEYIITLIFGSLILLTWHYTWV